MPQLKQWRLCHHPDWFLHSVNYARGDGPMYSYREGYCRACGRPLIQFSMGWRPDQNTVRDLRRHAAWMWLGKEFEHAGNTVVLDGV